MALLKLTQVIPLINVDKNIKFLFYCRLRLCLPCKQLKSSSGKPHCVVQKMPTRQRYQNILVCTNKLAKIQNIMRRLFGCCKKYFHESLKLRVYPLQFENITAYKTDRFRLLQFFGCFLIIFFRHCMFQWRVAAMYFLRRNRKLKNV